MPDPKDKPPAARKRAPAAARRQAASEPPPAEPELSSEELAALERLRARLTVRYRGGH